MPKPILEISAGARTRRVLMTGEPVTLGRDPANSIAFDDSQLDPFHCVIECDGPEVCVRDLQSRTGTRVNGQSVERAALTPGDQIQVGRITVRLLLPKPEPRRASPDRSSRRRAHARSTESPRAPSEAEGAPPGTEVVRAVEHHAAALSRIVGSLPETTLEESQITLVNARGQAIAVPQVAGAREAVQSGKEGVLFLRGLLLLCLRGRASDLHVEPRGTTYDVRIRVDGMMVGIAQLHPEIGKRLLRVVKVLCDIDIAQQRAIQEGHFNADVPGRRVYFRVSFTPVLHGQKLVVRVLDVAQAPQTIRDLGLPAWMRRDLEQVVRQDTGMVLVCGTTGSGKTTTLYAHLRAIDRRTRNVITIEDPIEYEIDGATQLPINDRQGQTFSTLLASVLRQDPDVILIGEIRDRQTADIAMQAAMTGHLVFSTVHARDTIGSIFRLLDLGVEPYLVASALNIVLAQRLARNLCRRCRRPRNITPAETRVMANHGVAHGGVVFEPVGCPACLQTGYFGRRAIFELLTATDKLRDVILTSPQIQHMRKAVSATVFMSLHEAGYRLVAEGITSMGEVDRVVGAG